MIVLADRYVFTAFARDVVRDCDRRGCAGPPFAPRPDQAFYFNPDPGQITASSPAGQAQRL
jgi:thymidylate kinase